MDNLVIFSSKSGFGLSIFKEKKEKKRIFEREEAPYKYPSDRILVSSQLQLVLEGYEAS